MFPYHGPIKELRQVLHAIRPRLKTVYRDVLGPELFKVLEVADERYLNRGSFISTEAMEQRSELVLEYQANRFVNAAHWETSPVFQEDGTFVLDEARIAPAFVFVPEAFKLTAHRYEKWISPYLGPYLHEYDHFVLWALQRYPMLLAQTIMVERVGVNYPFGLDGVAQIVEEYQGSREDKVQVAQYAAWQATIHEHYETSTRRLDEAIFQRLGYKAPADYWPNPKEPIAPLVIPVEPGVTRNDLEGLPDLDPENPNSAEQFINELSARGFIIIYVEHGDLDRGMSIAARLEKLRRWLTHFTPRGQIQENFVQSYFKVRIKKQSFSGLDQETTEE